MSDGERKNFPPNTLGYLPCVTYENALKVMQMNLIQRVNKRLNCCSISYYQ